MSTDVLDLSRPGKCPCCGAVIQHPDTVPEADGLEIIEGGLGDWCPACGWEASP